MWVEVLQNAARKCIFFASRRYSLGARAFPATVLWSFSSWKESFFSPYTVHNVGAQHIFYATARRKHSHELLLPLVVAFRSTLEYWFTLPCRTASLAHFTACPLFSSSAISHKISIHWVCVCDVVRFSCNVLRAEQEKNWRNCRNLLHLEHDGGEKIW